MHDRDGLQNFASITWQPVAPCAILFAGASQGRGRMSVLEGKDGGLGRSLDHRLHDLRPTGITEEVEIADRRGTCITYQGLRVLDAWYESTSSSDGVFHMFLVSSCPW